LISDLRSQQVRDTCLFLTALASIAGDQIKLLLREIFPTILEAMKQPHKVMSGYIDNCILSMIRNATFKVCISMIVGEIKESKSKMVRENCIEYINEVLINWDLQEKDMDPIDDAVKMGLEEASVRGREVARLAYLNLRDIFPKRSEKIKCRLSSALQAKLYKAELDHDRTIGAPAPTNAITRACPSIEEETSGTTIIAPSSPLPMAPRGRVSSIRKPLRSPKPDATSVAVTSIQAFVRGAMTRRKSINAHESPSGEEDIVGTIENDHENEADLSIDFGGMIEAMIAEESPAQPKTSPEPALKHATPKKNVSSSPKGYKPTSGLKALSSTQKSANKSGASSGTKLKKIATPPSRSVLASLPLSSTKKETTPQSSAKSKKGKPSPSSLSKEKATRYDPGKILAVLKLKLSQTMYPPTLLIYPEGLNINPLFYQNHE